MWNVPKTGCCGGAVVDLGESSSRAHGRVAVAFISPAGGPLDVHPGSTPGPRGLSFDFGRFGRAFSESTEGAETPDVEASLRKPTSQRVSPAGSGRRSFHDPSGDRRIPGASPKRSGPSAETLGPVRRLRREPESMTAGAFYCRNVRPSDPLVQARGSIASHNEYFRLLPLLLWFHALALKIVSYVQRPAVGVRKSDTDAGSPDVRTGRGLAGIEVFRGVRSAPGMSVGERGVNRLCMRFCGLVGLDGFWTESGPTARAQRAFHQRRPRTRRTLVSLAFYVWGRRGATVLSLADLLALPPREMARAFEFVRGWRRKQGDGSGSAPARNLLYGKLRALRGGR